MASVYGNLQKDILAKFNLLFSNKYKKLGLKWADVKKTRAVNGLQIHTQSFLGGTVFFKNGQELMHGLDEIFLDEVYRISLPANAFIVDCGAHIGLSVIYLKKLFPDAHVIAFEPDKTNFELLQKNVSSYQLQDVELRNEAVWKENTTLSFSGEGNMSSRIDETAATISHSSSVKAIRLHDVIDKKTDFLKLDVEGAEYDILIDIESRLHNVTSLFIEYHGSFEEGYKLNRILQLLDNNHFKFYIREANPNYFHPFTRGKSNADYDVQLNIFCFR